MILFLHGFPEFWLAWHRQLEEFGQDHQAVAVDLRGYNQSDKPRGVRHYALPRIVADVRALIRALSPNEPITLVGHDWGGFAGWVLAQDNPELLEHLVIINAPHPALFYRELKHSWSQRIGSTYALLFQLRGVSEMALRAFDYAVLRQMIFGTTAKPDMFPETLRAAYRAAWSQPYALAAGLHYYRNLRTLRRVALQATQPVHVPTLVLWDDHDAALKRSNLSGLEKLVLRLSVVRHPTATHWIVHEEPHWVNGTIRRFIS